MCSTPALHGTLYAPPQDVAHHDVSSHARGDKHVRLQDSRADILMAVHACLLTHFGGVNAESSAMPDQPAKRSSRASSNGRNGSTPGGHHSNGRLHALSEVCLAHVEAIKVCLERESTTDACSAGLLSVIIRCVTCGPPSHACWDIHSNVPLQLSIAALAMRSHD